MIHLYIVDYFNRNGSGLTTYVNLLSSLVLEEKSLTVSYIWVNARGERNTRNTTVDEAINYFVDHDLGKPNFRSEDGKFAKFLSEQISTTDKVIFHFNWINHASFSYHLKKTMNCICLLNKHCIPWRDSISTNYPFFLRLEKQLRSPHRNRYLNRRLHYEWLAYNAVDHIICVTHFAKDSLTRMFSIPERKISIINNGFDLPQELAVDSADLKVKYGFNKSDKIILFAGALHERKGVTELISAFNILAKQNQEIRLLLAGDGDFRSILKSAKGIWSRITITGLVDKETLYDFYRMASLGVVPSYVEQCSYTCIEMMHHGLPMIATSVDGLNEMVKEEFGYKVPLIIGKKRANVDILKLVEKIEEAINNPNELLRRADLAREYAKRQFNLTKMRFETLSVYKNVLHFSAANPNISLADTSDPLVTVILPCHNGEQFLAECIDSVLQQTYSHIELLVINDGSTDSSLKIVNGYDDPRIKILDNSECLGIVQSLNRGLSVAKGEFIARIDADDLMRKDRIFLQVDRFKKDKKKELGLLGSNHIVIDDKSCCIGMKEYPQSNEEIRNCILFQNPFSHPSVMMRAEVARDFRYSEEFPFAEDYNLWFSILKRYKAENLPDHLTFYRLHNANVSKRNPKVQRLSVANLLAKQLDILEIDYSAEDLKIHLAVNFGLDRRIFNNRSNVQALDLWIEKVYEAVNKQNNIDFPLYDVKDRVKRLYCDIN